MFTPLKSKIATGIGVVAGLTQTAWAQAPGNIANEEPSWLVWAIFGGIALIVCATGFLNAKRSHLN